MTRRDAVASFALLADLLASAASAGAQTPATPVAAAPLPTVFTHDLPDVTMNGWAVTVSYVDYAPGGTSPVHHHAGFVLAYVLDGAIVSKVSGQGDERTYRAGEMFYEQPGSTHEVSRNASRTQPARLLAMVFAKKGSTLTAFGPAQAPR